MLYPTWENLEPSTPNLEEWPREDVTVSGVWGRATYPSKLQEFEGDGLDHGRG